VLLGLIMVAGTGAAWAGDGHARGDTRAGHAWGERPAEVRLHHVKARDTAEGKVTTTLRVVVRGAARPGKVRITLNPYGPASRTGATAHARVRLKQHGKHRWVRRVTLSTAARGVVVARVRVAGTTYRDVHAQKHRAAHVLKP